MLFVSSISRVLINHDSKVFYHEDLFFCFYLLTYEIHFFLSSYYSTVVHVVLNHTIFTSLIYSRISAEHVGMVTSYHNIGSMKIDRTCNFAKSLIIDMWLYWNAFCFNVDRRRTWRYANSAIIKSSLSSLVDIRMKRLSSIHWLLLFRHENWTNIWVQLTDQYWIVLFVTTSYCVENISILNDTS